jgi:nitric oxide synthase-interacting protein
MSVTQSRDIKKQKKKLEALKIEAEEEKTRALEAARERVLREFEKSQLGLSGKTSSTTASSTPADPGAFLMR